MKYFALICYISNNHSTKFFYPRKSETAISYYGEIFVVALIDTSYFC